MNNIQMSDVDKTVATDISQQPYKQKNKVNGMKTGLIVLAVVLTIVLVCSIGYAFWYNSDDAKTNRAIGRIDTGELVEAVDLLYGIDSPKANALRDFIDIEAAKQKFRSAYCDYEPDSIEVSNALATFNNLVLNYDDAFAVYHLSESLLKRYESYRTALDYSQKESDAIVIPLQQLQKALLNKVKKNQSSKNAASSFTLAELQERVDATNSQMEYFKYLDIGGVVYPVTDPQVIAKCNVTKRYDPLQNCDVCYADIDDNLVSVMKNLYSTCWIEATYSQKDITNSLEEFEIDDSLYLENADPDYVFDMDEGLRNIASESDIDANARIIARWLRIALIYSLIITY